MTNNVTLPVHWLLPDGTPSNDIVTAKPCIEVGLTFELSPAGQFQSRQVRTVLAHLDTGLDAVVVSDCCLKGFSLRPHKIVETSTIHSRAKEPMYQCTLLFADKAGILAQQTEFIVAPLSDKPYRIMLGRTFLRETRFVWEPKIGMRSITINS